jgi:hypothetical protein
VAWTSVSPHGINLAEPLREAIAMSVANNTLFVAGYDRSAPEREAELWRATIGDERWTFVGRIPGMHSAETMAVHGTGKRLALYIGGAGLDGRAKFVRFHKLTGIDALTLPVTPQATLYSLLTVNPYLFVTLNREEPDGLNATIWRTDTPNTPASFVHVGGEISTGRDYIHSIRLARGWRPGEILVGTGRVSPGGSGTPGTGAEVWRGIDYGAEWEQLAEDGFGDPNTGAVPALQVFRSTWGSRHIYASALNHAAGSTVYKNYSGRHWGEMPYRDGSVGTKRSVPIRSMAVFEGRLFIAEGNNPGGARLYYTIGGDGWSSDPHAFIGAGGELPLALHALTPAYVSTSTGRQRFLYLAAQYEHVGVKIWRRALDLWDSVVSTIFEAMGIDLPFTSRRHLEF